MADQIASQQPMENTTSTTTTVTIDATDSQHSQDVPTVHLKLRKPKTDRKVQWTTETVDNEDMDKKKSKCCCIYKKQRAFGESSSDESSDDECDSCMGHVERKKKMTHTHQCDPETQNQKTDIPRADAAAPEEEQDDVNPDTTDPENSGPS